MTSSPSCVSKQPGNFDCFVRGTNDGGIHQRGYIDGNWSAWISLGGSMSAGPAASAKDDQGRIVVYAVSEGHLSSRAWWSTGGWGSWSPSPHIVAAKASFECDASRHGVCTDDALFGRKCEQRRVCLIRSDNKMMAWESADGLDWFGEVAKVPLTGYRPEVLLDTYYRGHFFVIDNVGRFLKTAPWKTGVGLTGPWQNIGGIFSSGVSCTGTTLFMCVGRGDNGTVWISRQS